jgi:hypothetical protein
MALHLPWWYFVITYSFPAPDFTHQVLEYTKEFLSYDVTKVNPFGFDISSIFYSTFVEFKCELCPIAERGS